MSLYRGTIAFDEPRKIRKDAGSGKSRTREYCNARAAKYREAHREELRVYMREYMRARRMRKRAQQSMAI